MSGERDQCERSFYLELYHFPGTDRSLVEDTVTGRICLGRELAIYDESVFRWLRDHADVHIPRVFAFWNDGEKLAVVQELVSGETLADLLCAGTMTTSLRARVLSDVLAGVRFLHAANPAIIHRDIKPSNVMLSDDGIAKLVDYDAAKRIRPEETKDTILIGTAGSAAPEQYGFGKVDQRTDIYALGCLLEDLFPDNALCERISARAKMLDPRDRYQSVDELESALVKAGILPPPPGRTLKSGVMRVFFTAWEFISSFAGLRSRNPLIRAGMILLYLVVTGISFFTENTAWASYHGLELFLYQMTMFLLLLTWIDVFGGGHALARWLPGGKKKKRSLPEKIFAAFLGSLFILVAAVLLIAVFCP